MDLKAGAAVRPGAVIRRHRVLALAALTGVATGAAVAAFDWIVNHHLFERVLDAPLGVQIAVPTVGLIVAAVALATLGRGATPSTSDEYIRNFHDPGHPLDLRPVWGRIVAGAATLGTGGALGYEGPSLYLGSAIGTAVQRRWARWLTRDDVKVLMVAGAAAGVAAIFKAPATGAVFALEVPYRDDNARRMLLPALLAAACGYLTFVALLGTEPIFAVSGTPPFGLRELGGAVVLGLLCGAGARLFAAVLARAKDLGTRVPPVWRIPAAGAVLAALALVSLRLFDETLTLGSGYRTVEWVTEPAGHGLGLILALFALRLAATATTVAGGGVGGLFVPLVVAGAITGGTLDTLIDEPTTLFPLIGVAAFLSAGYRTPLAGVMFVAETTGQPGFVVPGLIAAVASQLVMGDVSVSPYQQSGRLGHLERRFRLPISTVIDADVRTAPPDTTISDFYRHHLLLNRRAEVPVVEGSRYLGMVSLYDLDPVPIEQWPTRRLDEVTDRSWPTTGPATTIEDAVRTMEEADVEVLAVLDGPTFIGVVTTAAIVGLDEILGRTEPPER
jgi:CIC family chloride channel protein